MFFFFKKQNVNSSLPFLVDFGLAASFLCDPSLNEYMQRVQYIPTQSIPPTSKLCKLSAVIPRTKRARWDMEKKMSFLYSVSEKRKNFLS